jgi:hypothetical protein
MLIGKPKIQEMDGEHYIAIRYIGVKGFPVNQISNVKYPNVKLSLEPDNMEEEKSAAGEQLMTGPDAKLTEIKD